MTKLTITDWDEQDRPREKMMSQGIAALSNAELLAIIIGSGSNDQTAVELTKDILASCANSLNKLGKLTLDQLCRFKGIGPAKAISIIAANELGRRRISEPTPEREKITCSTDIYDIFYPVMCDLPIEECWILLLNQSNKVIDKKKISSGGISNTSFDPREILRAAIVSRASALAVAHNHPSNNNNPSQADDILTMKIKEAAKLVNVRLIDHIIVCDGSYYSYADEGRL